MSITREQVEYVANLSRIQMTEEEKEKFTQQLGDILTYIEKLNELDVENVPPISQASVSKNVFREDEPGQSLPQKQALANAPDQAKGFYKVPKIIE
ncbi:MAG: Asp-tRNA(Asn)/Glu-tRNA(Gln) amidotransferase subunit GatC [Planctomycetes bacterium]|nr:Asp-tRNA(Asn)/Glu-tRNA(Gln) amidotransferase subunit GatC [Planctomycetota bacterium]